MEGGKIGLYKIHWLADPSALGSYSSLPSAYRYTIGGHREQRPNTEDPCVYVVGNLDYRWHKLSIWKMYTSVIV